MSRIDDTIAAIKAGQEKLGEASAALQAAIGEAEETCEALIAFGAEGSAQSIAFCREELEQALATCVAVAGLLDTAILAAQEAVGRTAGSSWASAAPPERAAYSPGPPQGLTVQQFGNAMAALRDGTAHIGGDVVVHGSRASGTAGPGSDIDFAIRVEPAHFDALIAERFGTPNPGSAKERIRSRAVETGKIQAGESGLSRLRRSLEAELDMDVDLSVVRRGGPFDNPPFMRAGQDD